MVAKTKKKPSNKKKSSKAKPARAKLVEATIKEEQKPDPLGPDFKEVGESPVTTTTEAPAAEAPPAEEVKEVAPKAPRDKQYNMTVKHLLVFMELEDNEVNQLDIESRLEALKEWKKDNRKKTEWTQERRDAQGARMKAHYSENESKMKGRKISEEHREKLKKAQQLRQEKLREQKKDLAAFESQRSEFEAWKASQAS